MMTTIKKAWSIAQFGVCAVFVVLGWLLIERKALHTGVPRS